MHAVLLLSVAGARPAAGLVQVGAVSLARGRRSARRTRRFRRDATEGHQNPRVGFHRRDSLSGDPDTSRRHRRLERRELGLPGDARFHDRRRLAEAVSGFEMNGGQDLGGTHGHGPVEPEPNEPVFHAEWEKRAFALTLAMGMPGGWNIDQSRFARENRDPAEYLSMSYYQIWFAALETMLKERALVADDEVAAGHSLHSPKPIKRVLSPADVLK